MSDYNFAFLSLSTVNRSKFNGYGINTRLFIQRGFGDNFPLESMLYSAGANPEELMSNEFTRSSGFILMTGLVMVTGGNYSTWEVVLTIERFQWILHERTNR